MTQQKRNGHKLERKLWEMQHAWGLMLSVWASMCWQNDPPAKYIKDEPFTLLLKQLCYYCSAVTAVRSAKRMSVHYSAGGCFSIWRVLLMFSSVIFQRSYEVIPDFLFVSRPDRIRTRRLQCVYRHSDVRTCTGWGLLAGSLQRTYSLARFKCSSENELQVKVCVFSLSGLKGLNSLALW